MNYRSIANLSDQVLGWSRELPADFDLIVGIPRSGLLAATLLALYQNLPLTDLDGFIEGRLLTPGSRPNMRINTTRSALYNSETGHSTAAGLGVSPLKVLVVDDSMRSGQTLQSTKERIEAAHLPHEVYYGVVYIAPTPPKAKEKVDFYCEELSLPRIFEWNILHSWLLAESCVDIDGVLCRDPLEEEDDDGPCYEAFLRDVPPFHRPAVKIGALVTCRLEKYRALTEAWLALHGIEYDELIMMDYPDKAARRKADRHGAYKADVYKRSGAQLFIESNPRQARQIASLSGREVFCVETMQMIYPDGTLAQRTDQVLQDRHKHNYLKKAREKVRGKYRHYAHMLQSSAEKVRG